MIRFFLFSLTIALIVTIAPLYSSLASSTDEEEEPEVVETDESNHNWKKTSSQLEMVHEDTHEYTAWHNFVKRTFKCDITHKIRTDVWYCDIHDHTKSDVSLEETIHSRDHGH
ncbi:hypothetical protein [Aquibacillus sediminis]|uniref:hypothetical protein n=1 Tax=Aquibacillus sediminis TaxID=2574734 RepID=UPI00110859C8|nr:hypothetical protein [Aquibacillus sediminis]